MRIAVLGVVSAATLCCVEPARAQYGRSSDPCASQPMSTSAMGLLIGVLQQHGRDQACAEERRAQWDEYNTRQKAAKDAADAATAHTQAQEEAGRQAEAVSHRQAEAQAHEQRQHAALAEARSKRARAEHQAQAERDAAAAEAQRRQGAITLARAETAPGNHCREPDLARRVIEAWNGLDAMKTAGVKAIDIEHLTTVSFDAPSRSVACHGVFVTNQGFRIVGTATVRKNVAGDPMFVWERDQRQDLARYVAPAIGADSPELARSVQVQQATSTGAAPVLDAPATLSLTAAPQR